jgi:hypothetical protein
MARQILSDTLESMRVAFLKLEHCCSDCDQTAVAYLRHEFLTQLAELEAALAIIQAQALLEPGAAGDPSFAEPETQEEDNARPARIPSQRHPEVRAVPGRRLRRGRLRRS